MLLTSVLSATATGAASNAVPLIAPQATWRYLDDGADPGPFWHTPNYGDSSWSIGAGQFGYGEADEATLIRPGGVPRIITHYFRCTFTVARPADYRTLLFQVLRDDGVVAYLNGNEIFRMNMPDEMITHQTPAASPVSGDDESTYFPTNVSAVWLVDGTNTLAVELHQFGTTDASFDLSLTGIASSQNPTLSYDRQGGQPILEWNDSDFRLEQAPLPSGGWSWVTNAISPYEIPQGGSRLFRLRSR